MNSVKMQQWGMFISPYPVFFWVVYIYVLHILYCSQLYVYIVNRRYSTTVCSPQIVAVYQEWQNICRDCKSKRCVRGNFSSQTLMCTKSSVLLEFDSAFQNVTTVFEACCYTYFKNLLFMYLWLILVLLNLLVIHNFRVSAFLSVLWFVIDFWVTCHEVTIYHVMPYYVFIIKCKAIFKW